MHVCKKNSACRQHFLTVYEYVSTHNPNKIASTESMKAGQKWDEPVPC